MDVKETERFNKLLIDGYEELLREKPASPEEHYIYYLLKNINPELRKQNQELDAFYQQYEQKFKEEEPPNHKLFSTLKAQFYNENTSFDYEYFVIGGGVSGLSSAFLAAKQEGIKVGVADYVFPSTQGSSWGVGGSFVNVGGLPKKMLHIAAQKGFLREDLKATGWDVKVDSEHSWREMMESLNHYIMDTSQKAKVAMEESSIKYHNNIAKFNDLHSIELFDPLTQRNEKVTAKYILICTGARPILPENISGSAEFGITTDDVFKLQNGPGKTLIYGTTPQTYEFAYILKTFGFDVTVITPQKAFSNIDPQISEKLIKNLEEKLGIPIYQEAEMFKIEEENGQKKVMYRPNGESDSVDELFDTVLFTCGRKPDNSKLELATAGVEVNQQNGKIKVNERDETTIPHIFAVGDVADGRPQLTTSSIMGAKLLVKRLFCKSDTLMTYEYLPKSIMGPLEYAYVGYTEDEAYQQFGSAHVAAYHNYYRPLEWAYIESRPKDACYVKMVCVKEGSAEKVVGLHLLGPDASEILTGFIVCIRVGVTKENIEKTLGVFPTKAHDILNIPYPSNEEPKIDQEDEENQEGEDD